MVWLGVIGVRVVLHGMTSEVSGVHCERQCCSDVIIGDECTVIFRHNHLRQQPFSPLFTTCFTPSPADHAEGKLSLGPRCWFLAGEYRNLDKNVEAPTLSAPTDIGLPDSIGR